MEKDHFKVVLFLFQFEGIHKGKKYTNNLSIQAHRLW